MYIIAIAWMFVVACMAAVEATSTSVVGGLGTLLFYGILPLGLFVWLVGTPQRRRQRDARVPVSGASFTPRGTVPVEAGLDADATADVVPDDDRARDAQKP